MILTCNYEELRALKEGARQILGHPGREGAAVAAPPEEKVLAAKRSGIRRVVLPARNRRDVEEVQAELLAGLEFDYVETIDEALERILAPAPS